MFRFPSSSLRSLLLGVLVLQAAGGVCRGASAEEQMRFADGLYTRGLHDMAVREFIVVARDFPGYEKTDAVLFRIGECYRHLGETAGAGRFYKRVMVEFPQSPYRFRAEFLRAELFVTVGQYQDAAVLLRALLDAKPPEDMAASAAYNLGFCLEKLGDKKAASEYEKVVDRYPDSPLFSYACLALADLYGRAGTHEKDRRTLYRKAAEKPATPRVGAEAWFQLAELEFAARDYAASARAYGRLLELYPDDQRAGEARLQAAWASHNSGDYPNALDLAEAALSAGAGAEEEQWLYLQANSRRRLGKSNEAASAYETLLAKFPQGRTAPSAAYELALIAFRRKDFAAATKIASGVSPSPELEQDLCWLLAESYAGLGRNVEASTQYEKIIGKFPGSEREPLAMYRLARLRQEDGALENASAMYRRLAAMFPTNALAADALYGSAVCRTQEKQSAEALQDWTALAGTYPDYERGDVVLYQKALAETDLGRDKAAMGTLRTLLDRHAGSALAAEAWYGLGMLSDASGDAAAAVEQYRRALAANPGAPLKPRVEYRLALSLQKEGLMGPAADLLQGLLATPVRAELPPALIEWLARFQLDRKAYEEAGRAAEALVKAGAEPLWKQIGWTLAGQSAEQRGAADAAREAYQQALAQNAQTQDAALAALNLGGLLLAAGDASGAAAAYDKVSGLASGADQTALRARSYFGLGQASLEKGDTEAAARYFMSVAVLFDDAALSSEALFRAADAFGRLGRIGDRDKALGELRQRYPDSPWVGGGADTKPQDGKHNP